MKNIYSIATNEDYDKVFKEIINNNNKEEKSKLLLELGRVEFIRNNYQNAIKCFEAAQKDFQELNNTVNIAITLAELALVYYKDNSDRLIRSLTLLNDAGYLVDNKESAKNAKAKINYHYGLIYYQEKRYSEAIKYYRIAQEYTSKDSLLYAKILDNFAIYYLRINNYQIAKKCLIESLKIKKTLGYEREIALTNIILGRYLQRMENYEEALIYLQEAYKISYTHKDKTITSRVLDELAKNYIVFGDIANAEKSIDESIELVRDNELMSSYVLCTKAEILIEKKEIDQALELLDKNDIVFSQNNRTRGKALVRLLKAQAFSKNKQYEKAIGLMHEAIELYKMLGSNFELTKSYYQLALIYKTNNNIPMATSTAMEAFRCTNCNEYPILSKKIEDALFELDEDEWSSLINKTARKEKAIDETKSLLDALDIIGNISNTDFRSKDPLLALLRIGRSIAAETNVDSLLEIIAQETKKTLNADRCTVFLLDKNTDELWSKVALGMGSQEIRFPASMGLAGHVAKTGESVNIKEAYNDGRFNKEVDKKTGYKTETILCMPMRNLNHEVVGVFQVLNKKDGIFNDEDEDLLIAIGSSAGIALENARLFQEQQLMYDEQKKSFNSFINTLAASIDARDKITSGHSQRVTGYSVAIAKQMNMEESRTEAIECAAILHDFGKIGIKDSVLCKEGKLTSEEYKHIQEHAKITYDLLENMFFEEKFKDVPEIAASHHEKFDGSGYFRKRKGEEIHIGGRILAVADVFDAITSKRHYRDRMPIKQALCILKKDSGTHFDPFVVDTFFDMNLLTILNILTFKDVHYLEKEKKVLASNKMNDLYKALIKEDDQKKNAEKEIITLFEKYYKVNEISKI